MKKIDSYICFDGKTEEAFNFYRSVFGGEFSALLRWNEMPEGDCGGMVSEADGAKIMHISLPVGGGNVLMGNDVLPGMGPELVSGNNFSISISTDDKAEADRLFNALSENGQQIMPINDTFWGSYFGMLTDQFGINWMVSFDRTGS